MKLIVIGAGGHAGAVIKSIESSATHTIAFLLDSNFKVGDNRHGYEIEDSTKNWSNLPAFIALGDNNMREEKSKLPFHFVNVSHPTALHGKLDCMGSFFSANSVVGNNSKVGNFSIINTGVILEHDSSVGDFSHLAPGVVTGGRVKIGSRTFVGINSTVRDGITIGSNVTVGMASCVLKDLPDNCVAWGNPCEIRNKICKELI